MSWLEATTHKSRTKFGEPPLLTTGDPQAANRKPQTTNHKPQTTNHKPQTTNLDRRPTTSEESFLLAGPFSLAAQPEKN
jgi:CD68 antigen